MKNIIKRIILGILIIINCSLIFYFSNQVADDSSEQSSRVVNWITEVVPSIKKLNINEKNSVKEALIPIVRKTAHFSIYGMLGVWTACFTSTFEKLDKKKVIIYSILFCMFYAITDEIHQIFIEGRSCELRDILIDTLGGLTGIMFVLALKNIVEKLFHKKDLKESKI